jgi:hypothetical protein
MRAKFAEIGGEPLAGSPSEFGQLIAESAPHSITTRRTLTFAAGRCGSWSCENALAEALTRRDFGEVAMLGHFTGFGGFSVWKYS